MKRHLLLTLLISLSVSPSLFARVWTDRQGRQTEAQFIRIRGDSVVLQKGMKPLIIPLKELCDEDQEYLKEQTKGKGGVKSPAAAKDGEEPADRSTRSTTKAKKTTADGDDDSNPFLTDDEKPSEKAAETDQKKPKAEKTEKADSSDVPKINTDGGFDPRGWTDVQGNKLRASFVRLDGKMAVLSKDGAEKQIPIDQFCYKDKLYIRQAALERQRYEKFSGSRGAQVAQDGSMPPGMAGPPRMPGMGGPPTIPAMPPMASPPPGFGGSRSDAMIEEMRQRALAHQQRMASAPQFSGPPAPPEPPQFAGPPTPMSGPPMPGAPVWRGPTITPRSPLTPGGAAQERMNSLRQQMQANSGGAEPTVIVRQNSPQPGVTFQPNNRANNGANATAYRVGLFIGVGMVVLSVLVVGVVVLVVVVKMISR